MNTRKIHNTYFGITILLLIILGILSALMLYNASKLNVLDKNSHKLLALSFELKESSDKLTSCCRNFVLTSDSNWEKKYWEILDIRNGKKARPDGRIISLRDSVKKLGLEKVEFEKLKIAEDNSNTLVWTEKIAFNAMKGRFSNASKRFDIIGAPDPTFAREIIFDQKYFSDKESIMRPISEFQALIESRTEKEINQQKKINNIILWAIIIIIITLSFISFKAIFVLRKKIIRQLKELKRANLNIQKNHEQLQLKNEELDFLVKQKTAELQGKYNELVITGEDLRLMIDELTLANEKAEENNRLKTSFLQNLNHEIRTPLNAILGFSNLLPESFNDKEKLAYFTEVINNRSNDLLAIINDLLDIAKIETGQIYLNKENCNLKQLFKDLKITYTELQLKQNKEIQLSLETEENRDIYIFTDCSRLKQIFVNLLNNAFKFTSKGYIKGGCKIIENNKLQFYVTDTGIGIPADKHESVFERFYQVDTNSYRSYSGMGLGLSIVKGLLVALGGDIWLESEPGKGSTFYFSLDCEYQDNLSNPTENTNKHEDIKFNNKTLLVVEDDACSLVFLKEILSELGLRLLFAENGKDAVNLALEQKPDLVLMDIRLPNMTGYEATRLIKEQEPEIVIIAQTAFNSEDYRKKAFEAGCEDIITKPMKRTALVNILTKYLNK